MSSPPRPTTVPAAATDPSLHLSASSSSTTTTLTTASETGAAGTAAGTAAAKQPPEDLEMERRKIPTNPAGTSPLDPVAAAAADTSPAHPAERVDNGGRALPPETLQETGLQQQQQQPTIRPVGISAAELVSREVLAQKEAQDEEAQEDQGETVTADLEPFVNTGLLTWEKIRHAWLGGNTPTASSSSGSDDATAIPLEVDEIIDVIFASPRQGDKGGPRNFPQAVPLPQMVDILQDLWEAEGLDI